MISSVDEIRRFLSTKDNGDAPGSRVFFCNVLSSEYCGNLAKFSYSSPPPIISKLNSLSR